MIVDDKIFDFIYTIAMRDATLQKAYELIGYKTSKGAKKPDDYKKEELLQNSTAKDIIREYIDNIIAGNNPNFYDVEKDVEKSFDSFIKGKKYLSSFTFGNCQKLINMTVKYFYIVTYSDPAIRSHFNDCHCPMDKIMIERVISELDKANVTLDDINNKNRLNIEIPKKKKISKGYLRNSWSKIEQKDHKQYDLFQAAVKDLAKQKGVSPIEYDYLMWNN